MSHPDLRKDHFDYGNALNATAGKVLKHVTTTGLFFGPVETHYKYDLPNPNAANTMVVSRLQRTTSFIGSASLQVVIGGSVYPQLEMKMPRASLRAKSLTR